MQRSLHSLIAKITRNSLSHNVDRSWWGAFRPKPAVLASSGGLTVVDSPVWSQGCSYQSCITVCHLTGKLLQWESNATFTACYRNVLGASWYAFGCHGVLRTLVKHWAFFFFARGHPYWLQSVKKCHHFTGDESIHKSRAKEQVVHEIPPPCLF